MLGFEKAKHDVIITMDADLQHEPETVPALAKSLFEGSEFVMGSRSVAGGGVGFEWSVYRRVVSTGATLLAWGLTNATDPMTGFFGTTKSVYQRGKQDINAAGFKIALEMIVRCGVQRVEDIPITFREREAGESKLDGKVMRLYLEQLGSLYWSTYGGTGTASAIGGCVVMFLFFCYGCLITFMKYLDPTFNPNGPSAEL